MNRILKIHIQSRVRSIVLHHPAISKKKIAALTYSHFRRLTGFWLYIVPWLLIPRNLLVLVRRLRPLMSKLPRT
jgi:hypothetical protein